MPNARPEDPAITFVLGAGASMPYGLPSGAKLKQSSIVLAESIATQHGNPGFGEQFPEFSGIAPTTLSAFAERLDFSQLETIDDFLERNADLATIGKLIIARVIRNDESLSRGEFRSQARDNWLQRLNRLVPDLIDRAQDESISFVTFNYDRLVEHFFFLLLKHGRNLPESECHDKIERLRIIHVHGSLGSLRNNPLGGEARSPDTQNSASSLRLPFEGGLDKVSSVTTAQYLIDRSRHICFIGFGFHTRNLERLDIQHGLRLSTSRHKPSKGRPTPLTEKHVWATTVGVSEARIRNLNTYFDKRGVRSKIDVCRAPADEPYSLCGYVSGLPFLVQ